MAPDFFVYLGYDDIHQELNHASGACIDLLCDLLPTCLNLAHDRLTQHAGLTSNNESSENGLCKHAEKLDLLLHSEQAEVTNVLMVEHYVSQLRQVLNFTALGK